MMPAPMMIASAVSAMARRIIAPRRAGRPSPGASFEKRALARDLVAYEGEEVAVHFHPPSLGARPGEAPLRQSAVARHHVARRLEPHVGEGLEHAGERSAHLLPPHAARAAGLGPARALEHALLRHEAHQALDVVAARHARPHVWWRRRARPPNT